MSVYLFFFAKKNNNYVGLIMKFNPVKFFDGWEIVCEEEVDTKKCLLPYHPHNIFALSL